MRSEPLMLFEKLKTQEDIDMCIQFSLVYPHEVAEAAMGNWHIWDEDLKKYYVQRLQRKLKVIDLSKVDEILEKYSVPHIKLCNFKVEEPC